MSEDRKPGGGRAGGPGRAGKASGKDRRSGARPARRDGGRRPDRDSAPDRRPRNTVQGRTGDKSGSRRPRTDPEARTEEQQIYDGPPIPDDVSARDLDRSVLQMLQGLPEKLADRIAKHLVMAGLLVESDPETAYRHALAARARAARVAVVREACGETAYAAGRWAEALSELRAAKRLSGHNHYTAMMADCERALGRPDKAIRMDTPAVRESLDDSNRVELSIVVAGARSDQQQFDAALQALERERLDTASREPWVARLRYAYADTLLAAGRSDEALEWFHKAAAVDAHGITDAEKRATQLEKR